jgi:hypothetical protein
VVNNNNALRSSIKCAKQSRSPLPQQSTESNSSMKSTTKRPNENSQEQQQQEPVKRVRLSSRPADDTSTNSNRIVLRIRKPSEDLSSSRSETSNSSSSNPQLTVQIKEPLGIVKEDDENQIESQSSNVFDIFNQPPKEDEQTPSLSPKNQSPPPPPPPPSLENKDVHENSTIIDSNVKLSMDALLEAVDTLKTTAEVRTNEALPITPSTNESRPVQPQFAERRPTIKHPRKPLLQHRVVTSQPKPSSINNNIPLPSFEQHLNEQSLSPIPHTIPLRPLSISPTSTDTLEDSPAVASDDLLAQYHQLERTSSIETLSVKSEPIDNNEHQKRRAAPTSIPTSSSSISTKSFLISPPANTHSHKTKTSISSSSTTTNANSHFSAMITNSNNNNTFAPRISSTVPQKPNWPTPLHMLSSTRQPLPTTQKRSGPPVVYPSTAQRNSNSSTMRIAPSATLQPQSFDAFTINPPVPRRPNGITNTLNTSPMPSRNPTRIAPFNHQSIRPPIEDHQTPAEIQLIMKNFNDKFQQLLTDFTVKMETALESNRVKYEKELEETRRTYRLSMNELRTITTQQVQEMHNSLELQYWTRLSEMRNRYESTLQHQQINKSSKQFNGGPR